MNDEGMRLLHKIEAMLDQLIEHDDLSVREWCAELRQVVQQLHRRSSHREPARSAQEWETPIEDIPFLLESEADLCGEGHEPLSYLLRLAARRLREAEAELKAFDPDPVVCGCREAICPHTPIAKLPRQALVDHYKKLLALEKKSTADAEAALRSSRAGAHEESK